MSPTAPRPSLLRSWTALLAVTALLLTLVPRIATADNHPTIGSDLVISQVYGGGGNSGALYRTSFVELFNRSSEPIELDGLSFQRGSNTGNLGFGAAAMIELEGVVAPGGYFLVGLGDGANEDAEDLPVELDLEGDSNPAAVNAKVSIVEGTELLGCGATGNPCDEDELGRIVDLVGYGNATFYEGSGPAPALGNNIAGVRAGAGCQDTDDNAVDFSTIEPPEPRNSTSPTVDCDEDPPPPSLQLACQAPFTVTEGYSEVDGEFVSDKAITASASNVTGEVSFEVAQVEPEPEAGDLLVEEDGDDARIRFSDEVPGLDPTETDGIYSVTIEASDDTSSADCTVGVRLVPLLGIGELRSPVPDDVNGRTHVSPYALGTRLFDPHPNHVATVGVVTQRLLEENAGSQFDFEGFFVQSLDVDADLDGLDLGDLGPIDELVADGDERTSDGLWVSTGTFSTVRPDLGGPIPPQDEQYFAEPGDIVVLRGPVIEDFQQTTLANPFVVDVIPAEASGIDLETDIEVAEANPPDDVQEASVYWERLAGMQVEVPADSLAVSGNDHFAPSTSEFWVIRGDHPVAQRDDPDARRVFRDYHPLSNSPTDLSDGPGDQNAFRILLGSFGVKAAEGDATATITPVRSGDTLDAATQGGLDFAFAKYAVMVDSQPEVTRGPDPAASSLEVIDGFDPSAEYSVMVYNVENLYDLRSDPFSGCDLDADVVPDGQTPTSTCTPDEPGGSEVSPPFTYAPRSQEAYDAHRIAIAEQILVALEAPDIITIQEAEKQDVCVPVFDESSPGDSHLDCDLSEAGPDEDPAERGSGAPDTVEELAIEMFRLSDGAIRYEASGDALNGRDVRGITQAFLHRTDRVELVPVDELDDDPVLGAGDAVDLPYPSQDERTELAPWVLETANPKSVNAQLPQEALDAADALDESIDGGRFPQTEYVFTRGVQVGLFRIYPDGVDGGGGFVERYVTSNHMSAGPDSRTVQRTEQARLNAAVAEAAVEAGGRALATGDFNVFPRPDDPFPAYKTDPDREPSDQLAPLYERGFTNLHDIIIEEEPANTYSFIFRGISQILDHVFVDDATLDELVIARFIHVNTDFPADTPDWPEAGRGASDHDPLYARFVFEAPEPPADPGPPFDPPGPPPWVDPGPPFDPPGPPPWAGGIQPR